MKGGFTQGGPRSGDPAVAFAPALVHRAALLRDEGRGQRLVVGEGGPHRRGVLLPEAGPGARPPPLSASRPKRGSPVLDIREQEREIACERSVMPDPALVGRPAVGEKRDPDLERLEAAGELRPEGKEVEPTPRQILIFLLMPLRVP
jgi:hypothetical protein